ncbi:phosphoribosylformylglycinamidine synthase subunit PurS [Mucilaginibacter sp.]|jgi:phosphoribosylformylglycinamidine synthase|uniref:phosphoribosylformylglycinamidine synthase subunit PurS n=1 Tax=Mucilaginibacter sp. TaxID=1882438 RepID=UPI003566925E
MTKFLAEIDVMPKKEILDPQGKAVTGSMKNLGLSEIHNIRIGKHISLEIEADSVETANAKVDEACKNLLANLIMESYSFKLQEIA